MSFFAFVAQYYEERLHFYERLDLTRCSEAELLDIAGEASALHKFLTDILEEGYTATVNRLVGQTDAINRLQQFLSTVLQHLGGPSERERFYLFPDLIPLPQLTTETFAGGSDLRVAGVPRPSRSPVRPVQWTLPPASSSADQQQRWQAKTQVLMTEMVAFLHWICAAACPAQPRGARAVAPGYPADPLGTHLAATPRHADTRTTACPSLGGNLPTSVGTAETSMGRWGIAFIACLWKTSLRSGNAPTPLCHGCTRRSCHSGVVHAGMPRLPCHPRAGRHATLH